MEAFIDWLAQTIGTVIHYPVMRRLEIWKRRNRNIMIRKITLTATIVDDKRLLFFFELIFVGTYA